MRARSIAAVAALAVASVALALPGDASPRSVNDPAIADEATLKAMQAEIDTFDGGNRPAGSQAELDYITHLEQQMQARGLTVTRQPFTFDRWNPPETFSLEILDGPSRGVVDVAAYIPFSGTGTADGFTAPMVFARIDPRTGALNGPDVTGKIVIVDVPPAPLPMAVFDALSYAQYDPDGDLNPYDIYNRTWVAQAGMWVILDRLTNLGAAGVVAVLDLPEEAARGAYFPYDGNVRAVPGLYVDREIGAMLKAAADGVPAHMVMDATVTPDSTSYNLMATIPGADGAPDDEHLVLHSHTDGPNSMEDNGPVAVIALAEYFLSIPRQERPRPISIIFTSGHFSGWVGIKSWIRDNHDFKDKILTLFTLEHLGAREYLEQPDGSYALTGRNEPGGIFVAENEVLVNESLALFEREDVRRHMVVRPFYPSRERDQAGERGWPGEGTEFEVAGIRTVQYVTGPQYLLNWGVDTTEVFTDYPLMRRQIRGFAQFVHNIEHVPATALRSDDYTAGL